MPKKTSAQLDREINEALTAPAPSLATVKAWMQSQGIKESIYEGDGTITLSRIIVPRENRGAGLGTEALRKLTEYADRTGQRIVLTPSKDFGASSVARLTTFYKRFGFVENKGRRRDFTTRETMIREPRGAVGAVAPP